MNKSLQHLVLAAVCAAISAAGFWWLLCLGESQNALKLRVAVLLGVLFTLAVIAYFNLRSQRTREAYLFLGFCALLFSAAYAVGALRLDVSFMNVGVAQIREDVAYAEKLVDAISCFGDALSVPQRFDGMSAEEIEAVNQCKALIAEIRKERKATLAH